ncbi:MAG: T9SS type A sorting domain-containing protein [Flavobacteriales bacterium]
MRIIISIIFISQISVLNSQDWELVSEEFDASRKLLYHDPVSDHLFIGGSYGYLGPDHVGGIVSYDGFQFHQYGCAYDCEEPFNGSVNGTIGMTSFRDTLYLNGIRLTGQAWDSLFNQIPNTKGVIRYAGNEFSALDVSFENNNNITNNMNVFNVDDTLYVTADHLGNVAGFEGFGAAKYDGFEWSPFYIPSCGDFIAVTDLVKYQSTLYISGEFYSCEGIIANDIMSWNGEEWQVLGTAVFSSVAAAITNMEIYQDELYVSGPFFRTSGNEGECIMKWNGEEWSDLGSGLTANGLNIIEDMVIVNDELYISGRFEEVGGIPAHNLAKWDGNQWCAISHDFTNTYITSVGVYQDEFYVYASTEDYSNRLWKWTGTATTCSEEFNSISEQNKPSSLTLYPNPASDLLTITLPKQLHGLGTISITDGLGRTVEEFNQEIEAGSQMTIATLNLPKGLYTLKFRHEEGVYAARFVKE